MDAEKFAAFIQTLQPLADALELIREQEELSRRRRLILNAGQAVIFTALLFLLIQVRQVKWEEDWLPHVVRGLLTVGGFGFALIVGALYCYGKHEYEE